MTEEELLQSDDPLLRQLAAGQQEKSFFQSLKDNLKDFFSPQALPPLEVTSRPLSAQELEGSAFGAVSQSDLPWYRTMWGELRDLLFPRKQPPLVLTSRPVQVKEIFGRDEYKAAPAS